MQASGMIYCSEGGSLMSQPFMFEKPLGLRDTLPLTQRKMQELKAEFYQALLSWGYEFLATPALEFDDTVGKASAILDQELFRLFDREGHTVILRPDMTTPIARVAASSLKDEPLPLRLSYMASLFRAQQFEGGRPSEFEQIGAELIGDPSPYADAEMMSLMLHLLSLSGVENVKAAVGHVGFVNALLYETVGNEEDAISLRQALYRKNDVGFREKLDSMDLPAHQKQRLETFLSARQCNQTEALNLIKELLPNEKGEEITEGFSRLIEALSYYGVRDQIDIDLTLVNHMTYYTGIVFEGYGSSQAFPLCNGGRYNDLLSRFDRPAAATGFGIRLDRVIEAIGMAAPDVPPYKVLVLFDEDSAARAMRFASEKRYKGETVVLQKKDCIDEGGREDYYSQFVKRIDFTRED